MKFALIVTLMIASTIMLIVAARTASEAEFWAWAASGIIAYVIAIRMHLKDKRSS